MNYLEEYSQKELKLIEHYGFLEIIKKVELNPPSLYRMMMEKAFVDNDQDIYHEALRKCMEAFMDCKIYRLTKEWDDLITL